MQLIKDSIPLDKNFPFRIFKVTLPKNNNGPLYYHYHSYFEITYVEKGQGQYRVNGKEYTMESGDIIIFNNVEPHGWHLPDSDMEVMVMIFSPEFVAEKLAFFDHDYLKPFVERGSNFKNRIGKEEPLSHIIRADILEIYKEWDEKREGYPLMIKADVLRILTTLIRTSQ
ncbi:MAG: cupin domain-containing protein, partial [Lachnospiraceae bacterium]